MSAGSLFLIVRSASLNREKIAPNLPSRQLCFRQRSTQASKVATHPITSSRTGTDTTQQGASSCRAPQAALHSMIIRLSSSKVPPTSSVKHYRYLFFRWSCRNSLGASFRISLGELGSYFIVGASPSFVLPIRALRWGTSQAGFVKVRTDGTQGPQSGANRVSNECRNLGWYWCHIRTWKLPRHRVLDCQQAVQHYAGLVVYLPPASDGVLLAHTHTQANYPCTVQPYVARFPPTGDASSVNWCCCAETDGYRFSLARISRACRKYRARRNVKEMKWACTLGTELVVG